MSVACQTPTGRETMTLRRPQGDTEHKVDIYFKDAPLPARTLIAKLPFPTGMFAGHAPDCKLFTGEYRLQRRLDLGAFRKHDLSIRRTHIIQIDIDRKSGHLKDKKVHGRTALQGQPPFQERMTSHGFEQVNQKSDFFQNIRSETCSLCLSDQRFRRISSPRFLP